MYAGRLRLYNHIDSFVMVIRRGGRTTKQNAIDGMYMLLLFEFDYSRIHVDGQKNRAKYTNFRE